MIVTIQQFLPKAVHIVCTAFSIILTNFSDILLIRKKFGMSLTKAVATKVLSLDKRCWSLGTPIRLKWTRIAVTILFWSMSLLASDLVLSTTCANFWWITPNLKCKIKNWFFLCSQHDFPHFIYIILFLIVRLACGCLCFNCEAFYIFSLGKTHTNCRRSHKKQKLNGC